MPQVRAADNKMLQGHLGARAVPSAHRPSNISATTHISLWSRSSTAPMSGHLDTQRTTLETAVSHEVGRHGEQRHERAT
jgi:hypothetical protein